LETGTDAGQYLMIEENDSPKREQEHHIYSKTEHAGFWRRWHGWFLHHETKPVIRWHRNQYLN